MTVKRLCKDPGLQSEFFIPGNGCDIMGVLAEHEERVISIVDAADGKFIDDEQKRYSILNKNLFFALRNVEANIKAWSNAPEYEKVIVDYRDMILHSFDKMIIALESIGVNDHALELLIMPLRRAFAVLYNLVQSIKEDGA